MQVIVFSRLLAFMGIMEEKTNSRNEHLCMGLNGIFSQMEIFSLEVLPANFAY